MNKLHHQYTNFYLNSYIRLTETWISALYNNLFAVAVLMDLSKVFHCIPHDILIAK